MNRIVLRDHGILPGADVTLALHALFEQYPQDAEFVFEPGEYFFSPKLEADYRLSNSDVMPESLIASLSRPSKNSEARLANR